MVEHAFYQGLNLAQVLYLHIVWRLPSQHLRAALALVVAIPWWFRGRFPVNRFSDNYRSEGTARTVVGVMYRVKKWQYLAYKHVLLHGLNVTVAMTGVRLAGTPAFQLYWLLLNTAYVMEFFLQTLVRRRCVPRVVQGYASDSIAIPPATIPLLISGWTAHHLLIRANA